MCDTLIATRLATSNGKPIFAKNSDRQPNEGQHIAYIPSVQHEPGSRVKCTYIEIPQVEKTNAILLSKPFWMWGAEIGINEHGVVIGNEAIFSKIPAQIEPALLGMDLLRLGLERAFTARMAMQIIIELLEEFGQGGNCVNEGEDYYHNSFIIADPKDAWVLETIERQWAARQVQDVYSISNCITLDNQFDLVSEGLVKTATEKGWARSAQDFNFAKNYSDFTYTTFGRGRERRATTFDSLAQQKGSVNIQSTMDLLRHHSSDPQKSITDVDVCMHAGWGPVRISQSTASLVALLEEDNPLIFVTGTSAPCTSIFKPVWLDASLPDLGPVPASTYDSASLFWCHERLHRATMLNYPERIKVYATQRDELEHKFVEGAVERKNASAEERAAFSAQCFRTAAQAEEDWLRQIEEVPARRDMLNNRAWDKFNRSAQMPPIS